MSISNVVKSVQDIRRQDAGVDGECTKNIATCMDDIFKGI